MSCCRRPSHAVLRLTFPLPLSPLNSQNKLVLIVPATPQTHLVRIFGSPSLLIRPLGVQRNVSSLPLSKPTSLPNPAFVYHTLFDQLSTRRRKRMAGPSAFIKNLTDGNSGGASSGMEDDTAAAAGGGDSSSTAGDKDEKGSWTEMQYLRHLYDKLDKRTEEINARLGRIETSVGIVMDRSRDIRWLLLALAGATLWSIREYLGAQAKHLLLDITPLKMTPSSGLISGEAEG